MERRREPGAKLVTTSTALRTVALLLCLLAALPRLAAQFPPGVVANDRITRDALAALDSARLGEDARLSLCVVDLEKGITVASVDADRPMVPASLLKLLTTAAALETLGPKHYFTTRAEATGSIRDGVLYGDLIIRGGGDMTLGPRFTRNRNDVTGVLDEWSREIKRSGIRTINGSIIGDDSRYVREPHALGWDIMEFGEWYSAEVSPLCYNDNCIDIIWDAGRKGNALVPARKVPDTNYVTLSSGVRVGPAGMKEPWLRYFRFKESNEIRARGVVPAGQRKYDFAAIHDPATFTAYLLRESLAKNGISVAGPAASARTLPEAVATTTTLTLVEYRSPSLADILPVINGTSQNLYAEVLLREVALARGEQATFTGGGRAVENWLLDNKLHRSGFVMVDGSGLSNINRTTARLMTDVLRRMANGPHEFAWRESLATPGSGSLRTRFQEPEFAPLQKNLRAKTGYLSGVITMGGYFRSEHGTEYAFTVMVNNFSRRRTVEAREFIDSLVLAIQQSPVLP